jgi:recombination protein RecT
MTKELIVQEKINTVRKYINQPYILDQLKAALPSFLTPARFLRVFFTAMLRNPALLDCSKESMLSAMIESAQLGLEPILRKAALVPYGKEVQFQPMYGGLIDLARRTGRIKITGHVVYEKDDFNIEYGTQDRLLHKPYMGNDPGVMIGAYTVWTFEDGFQTFLFMPAHEIYKVRATSKAWQKAQREPKNPNAQETPWIQWEDQQWVKTVLKRHSKLQPCSIEMERAVELDNRVEAGLSQTDILGRLGETVTPEKEPELPDIEKLIEDFDKAMADMDTENVNAFLDLVAATQEDMTRDQVKIAAMVQGIDGFRESYMKWPGYKPKEEAGRDNEDPIRKLYWNLKGSGFRKFVMDHQSAILSMAQEYQDEIRQKWERIFPKELYPIGKIETGDEIIPGTPPGSPIVQESEDERILKLVDGAEIEDHLGGKAIFVNCPNEAKGEKRTVKWCNKNCRERKGCPTWSKYDAENLKE